MAEQKPFNPIPVSDFNPIDIGSIMEAPKSDARQKFDSVDYVKTQNGYVLNIKANPNAKSSGIVTALDDKGQTYRINLGDKPVAALVPGLIEGNIRNDSRNQQTLIDKIKAQRLQIANPVMPYKPYDTGITFGNLAEGFKDSLPSGRNLMRMGGAAVGGTIGAAGGGITALPTVAGVPLGIIGGAAVGGGAGAAGADALYQTGQAVANRFSDDSNPNMKQLSDLLGKPATTLTDIGKGYAGAAGQGAMQEGGGKLISMGLGKLSKAFAERQVGQILAPATNAAKIDVREAAPILASNLPPSITDASLLNKLTSQTNTLGAGVDQAYQAAKAGGLQVPAAPVLKALNDVRDSYFLRGNPIAGSEGTIAQLDKLIDQIGNNPNLDPQEYRQIKGVWDELINWSRNSQARTPQTEKAFTTGANAIRNALHTASPSLEAADTQFSLMKTAKDALQAKVDNAYGKPFGSGLVTKGNMAATAIGGGIGALTAGTPGAAIGAGTGDALNMLMNTTAYRTMSLSAKNQVQALLAKGMTQKAIGLILSQGVPSVAQRVSDIMSPKQ